MEDDMWMLAVSFRISDGETEYVASAVPGDGEWTWDVWTFRHRGQVTSDQGGRPVKFEASSLAPNMALAFEYVDRYKNGEW